MLLDVLVSNSLELAMFVSQFWTLGVCTLNHVHFIFRECAYFADFYLLDRASEGVIVSSIPDSLLSGVWLEAKLENTLPFRTVPPTFSFMLFLHVTTLTRCCRYVTATIPRYRVAHTSTFPLIPILTARPWPLLLSFVFDAYVSVSLHIVCFDSSAPVTAFSCLHYPVD
jgi:hypothetical protein